MRFVRCFVMLKRKKKDSMKRFDSNFVYRSFALDSLPHKQTIWRKTKFSLLRSLFLQSYPYFTVYGYIPGGQPLLVSAACPPSVFPPP